MSISMTDLANGNTKEVDALKNNEQTEQRIALKEDKPVELAALKEAWIEFTEQRKSQVGEYHLLKQEFEFSDNLVTIHLSNQVEEPLLQSVKPQLTEFLRQRLSNGRINITSQVKEIQSQKIAYTNKEKFDLLAEKNPILKELKKRLDLDPDF